MNLSVIADLTRNPCRAGRTSHTGKTSWMPGQARHDKFFSFSVIADLIRNPCRADHNKT